jgi:hypothetical protein
MNTANTTPRTRCADIKHYPETVLPRTGHCIPRLDNFVDKRRLIDFIDFESCLDAPLVLPLGGSLGVVTSVEPVFSMEYSFVGRELA